MAREFIRKSRRQILRIIVVAVAACYLLGRGMAGTDQPDKSKDVSEQIVAVSTAEDFLDLRQALAGSGPDAPKPKPIEKFLATHPKAVKAITVPKPTPASFATEPYFGVNAFLFTNRDGKARYSRYHLRPEAGARFLSDEDAAKQPASLLIDELGSRLSEGPARFRLVVQLAAEGDPVNDATAVWPATGLRLNSASSW